MEFRRGRNSGGESLRGVGTPRKFHKKIFPSPLVRRLLGTVSGMSEQNKKTDKFFHERTLRDSRRSGYFTADLYVPFQLYFYALERIQKNKSLSAYLEILLKEYREQMIQTKRPHSLERTSYQRKSQDLKRLSFRPKEKDWAELRTIARYLGISMCKTFVLLLEMEKNDEKKNPHKKTEKTKFRIQSLIQKFSHKRDQITFELIVDW